MPKLSTFETILLLVGVAAAFLGFQLINYVYSSEGTLSWLMILSIFTWLILILLFILLSLMVDTSRKELAELKKLVEISKKKKRRA